MFEGISSIVKDAPYLVRISGFYLHKVVCWYGSQLKLFTRPDQLVQGWDMWPVDKIVKMLKLLKILKIL